MYSARNIPRSVRSVQCYNRYAAQNYYNNIIGMNIHNLVSAIRAEIINGKSMMEIRKEFFEAGGEVGDWECAENMLNMKISVFKKSILVATPAAMAYLFWPIAIILCVLVLEILRRKHMIVQSERLKISVITGIISSIEVASVAFLATLVMSLYFSVYPLFVAMRVDGYPPLGLFFSVFSQRMLDAFVGAVVVLRQILHQYVFYGIIVFCGTVIFVYLWFIVRKMSD